MIDSFGELPRLKKERAAALPQRGDWRAVATHTTIHDLEHSSKRTGSLQGLAFRDKSALMKTGGPNFKTSTKPALVSMMRAGVCLLTVAAATVGCSSKSSTTPPTDGG